MCSLSYPFNCYKNCLGLSNSSILAVFIQSYSFFMVPSIFFIMISLPLALMISSNITTQPPNTINAVLLGFFNDLIQTIFSVFSLSTALRLQDSLAFASCTLTSTYRAIYNAYSVCILAYTSSFDTIFYVSSASFFSTQICAINFDVSIALFYSYGCSYFNCICIYDTSLFAPISLSRPDFKRLIPPFNYSSFYFRTNLNIVSSYK